MCWVAADRGARLARLREDAELAERWQAAADEIHADICAHGVDERGVFTQHYDTDALDASLLLMPLVRFLPPDDPRVRATVLAIADELTVDGLVLRYRVKETDDGLSGEEGTFTICSFWLVSALAEIGERLRAAPAVREAAVVRQPARPVRRGDRPPQRPAPRQLPAGLHPPRPHQRGHARHPRRGGSAWRPRSCTSTCRGSGQPRPLRRRAARRARGRSAGWSPVRGRRDRRGCGRGSGPPP